MTEDSNSPSHPAPEIAPAPQSLRQAREAAGLQVAALAAMLKVPVDRLQALEDGRYQELPNLTFARALASSVCRALKIDPVPVLQSLPRAVEVRLGSDQPLETGHFSSTRRRPVVALSGLGLRSSLVWALLLLALAVVLWWWLPQREASAPPPEAAAPAEGTVVPPAQEPAGVPPQALPADPAPAAATPVVPTQPDQAQPAPVPPAIAPPVPAPVVDKPVAPVSAAPAPAAVAAQPLLQLRARATTWVQLKDAAGKELRQRTLQAGQTLDYDGDAPLQVVLGRADGVEVIVRGQVFDTSAYAANKVARFEVK
ncbi:helix-turn-helix domain-containing protein [Malikia sp.]|uniref:helix-turn-helix domain-containing protein n=1 Tax=Malikia sp. TaxID=2070706 RepID=UPI0026171383|nr:helix-turn-helix domain-containing protein [Malikia sp.]MDD2728397.1 helix-turn-helix domain-containing protein [Malikia sp.]